MHLVAPAVAARPAWRPLAVALVAVLAVGAAPAGKAARVSGPSFLHGCEVDPDALSDPADHELELEAAIAVHPADDRKMAAAWLQGENLAVVAAFSEDGGREWRRHVIPGVTTCTGGSSDIAFNPSIAYTADGAVHVVATASGGYFPDPRGALTHVVVATSMTNGASWSTQQLALGDGLVDFPKIAARDDRAFVVWSRRTLATDSTFASRTLDAGKTWSTPALVRASAPDRLGLNYPVVLGDGRFFIATEERRLSGFVRDMATDLGNPVGGHEELDAGDDTQTVLTESTDGLTELTDGVTWTTIATLPGRGALGATADHNGAPVVLSQTKNENGSRTVEMVHQVDDGDWATKAIVTLPRGAWSPKSFAIDATGALAFVSAVPAAGGSITFAALTSSDGGMSWRERALATTRLPEEHGGFYLGASVAPLTRGFGVVAPLGEPQAKYGPTDVFFFPVQGQDR